MCRFNTNSSTTREDWYSQRSWKGKGRSSTKTEIRCPRLTRACVVSIPEESKASCNRNLSSLATYCGLDADSLEQVTRLPEEDVGGREEEEQKRWCLRDGGERRLDAPDDVRGDVERFAAAAAKEFSIVVAIVVLHSFGKEE